MKRPTKLDRLIYRIFYYFWNPILKQRPDLVVAVRDYMDEWIKIEQEGK